VWDYKVTDTVLSDSERRILTGWEDNGREEAATVAPTVIADATTENIQKAKELINGLMADGGNVAVCCAGIALLTGLYC
jgi:protein-tyrosine phosphatase